MWRDLVSQLLYLFTVLLFPLLLMFIISIFRNLALELLPQGGQPGGFCKRRDMSKPIENPGQDRVLSPGARLEAEENRALNRHNGAGGDPPFPPDDPDRGRVQRADFWQSLSENTMALEAHGFSRYSIDARNRPAVTQTSLQFNRPNSTFSITTMTVPSLAILVRRLGLVWKTFDPARGILLAEGNNQYLTSIPNADPSTLCVRYTISALSRSIPPTFDQHLTLTIPTPQATQMLFGIIPPFPRLSLPGYCIRSVSDIHEVANVLDPSGHMSRKIHDVRHFESKCTLGFSDLIPFAAPMIRARGSALTRIPSPSQYTGGLTRHRDGFRVFRLRLRDYLAEQGGTARMKWVQKTYETLLDTFPDKWEQEIQPTNSINSPSRILFLDHCQDVWEECTVYFEELNTGAIEDVSALPSPATLTRPGFTYCDLLVAHLKHAVGYWGDAWRRVKNGTARDALGGEDWIAEGAHCYWDYLPRIAATLRQRAALAGAPNKNAMADEAIVGKEDEESPIHTVLVHEAWTVMMLRAFCWWRCHWTDQGWWGEDEARVDPRYWDDETGTGAGDWRTVYVF